jgi:hypothetical protein
LLSTKGAKSSARRGAEADPPGAIGSPLRQILHLEPSGSHHKPDSRESSYVLLRGSTSQRRWQSLPMDRKIFLGASRQIRRVKDWDCDSLAQELH